MDENGPLSGRELGFLMVRERTREIHILLVLVAKKRLGLAGSGSTLHVSPIVWQVLQMRFCFILKLKRLAVSKDPNSF